MNQLFRISVLFLLAGLAFAVPAQADFLYWTSTTDDWVDVVANWTCTWPDGNPDVVPGTNLDDFAIIKTAGVVKIDADHTFYSALGDPEAVMEIYVGDGNGITISDPDPANWTWPYSPNDPGAGHVLQTGGTVNYLDWLTVGRLNAPGTRAGGDESTYELQGGSIVETGSGGYLLIGDSNAAGTMTVTGTELTPASISVLNNSTFVGLGAGSDGLLSMSGPYSTATLKSLLVGYSGSAADNKAIGAVNLSDGAKITVNEWCNAGVWNYSEGSIALSGSSELTVGGGLVVGDNWGGSHANPAPGKGTLTLSGSAKVTVGTEFHVGSLTYAEGTLTMSGSSELTTGDYTSFGRAAGKATVTLSDNAVFKPLYGHLGGTGNFPDPPDLPFGDTVDITMNDKSRIEATHWLNFGEAYCTATLTMNSTRDPDWDPPSISAASIDFGWGENTSSTTTMNGTSSISVTGNVNIAVNGANAHGSVTMNDNSSVSAGFLVVGSNGVDGLGILNMNDSASFVTVDGIAIANVGGADGTVTMTGDSSLTTAGWIAVGNSYNGGGTGQAFLSGNAYMATTGNELEIAWGGTGILHIGHENPADNAVVSSYLPVVLGQGTQYEGAAVPTNARIDINRGGTLEAPGIITGNDGAGFEPQSSVLNFNGGTLKATDDNADFITNGGGSLVFEVNVQEYGAQIHTNGHDITITVPLTEDASSQGGGLTKLGTGTLTLAGGTNTYTGDTIVSEGILSTTSNTMLYDLADLWIALHAEINLDFALGTADTIAALYLGADPDPQDPGTWGATGSGADHIDDDYFSGTGMVLVGTVTPIPGDADHDNDVDKDDLNILAINWGKVDNPPTDPVGWDEGDFDDDGVVGPADAAILAANWGYGTEEGNSAVPEPGLFVLLLGLALALVLRRVRR